MRHLSLEALRSGIHDSGQMREYISRTLQQPNDRRFTNTHAWALVDLQASREVSKRGRKDYVLAVDARAGPHGPVPEPTEGCFPTWASVQVARANRENGPAGPRFTPADLIAVWTRCGGRCAVTRQTFSAHPLGASLTERAYAPSLDRIKADRPYTRENCRLVMVAANFAMTSGGLGIYLKLARDAVRNEPAQDG